MLKIIQNKFKTPDNSLFKLLISTECPVKFHFLPLEEFKMEDEIYVKMNARGKPLTGFENFKANFSSLFDIDRKSKLDNEWLDIFWKMELNDNKSSINIDNVDKKYFNFLKNVTLNFYAETENISKDFREDFDIYDCYKRVYSQDKTSLYELSKVLDSLQLYDDKKKYFADFLKDIPAYRERLRFYALSRFFVTQGNLNETNAVLYNRWMRVCRNLINNSPINDSDDFCIALRSVKQLSGKICNLYEHIINPESKIHGFLQKQWDEEKIKANLILNHNEKNWNEKICAIENHPHFDGQIGFILNFSTVGEDYDINQFSDYSNKLSRLFGDEHQDKNGCLFQRALLTRGDYLVNINYDRTFCTFNSNDNWRKVFNDNTKSAYLKALLDNLDVNNIEDGLKKMINDYPDDNSDWRSLFIKNEGIIEYCNNYRIAEWDNGKIVLARSSSVNWRKHAELYSLILYKTKLENRQFPPFTKTWYWETTGERAVLDNWDYKEHHFTIDILYDYIKKYYTFRFYDKNGNMTIPTEIQEIIEPLNFHKNKNDNSWTRQNCGETVEETTQEINNLTSKLSEINNS
jgi:hypothetical protein